MPGLFGCLTIDPNQNLDASVMEQVYTKMSSSLKHLNSYTTDRRIDPQGRWMLGRIGHQNLMATDLHYVTGSRSVDTRIYGTLTGNKTLDGRNVPDNEDPLLGITAESGYFSAFCVDPSSSRLAIIVDRRASEPIYYIESGGILYFAPEVKALLNLGISPGDINTEAVANFFGAGHLLPHQTLFTNIKKLTSRNALIIDNMRYQEQEYWKYEPGSISYSGSKRSMQKELAELVQSSILNDFGTPQDTMTFLSGGLDSRYILACLARTNPSRAASLHSVTWAERIDIPQSDPAVATIIAKELGIQHQFKKRCNDEYEAWFKETNYLQDGQSEVSAQHPHEFQIMKELHQQGFNRVIRGDEAFGLLGRVYSPEAALAKNNIRPFAGIRIFKNVMHKNWYNEICSAGNDSFNILKAQGAGMDATDFKDVCYFTYRVPTYLSSAAYYKQVLFDHRNPLLSNEIMDFYKYVPTNLRIDKKLFLQAFAVAHPDLAQIPYSRVDGTEDWGTVMASDTPLRKMILKELSDTGSGVWEIFDRQRVVDLFNNITMTSGSISSPAWKKPLRKMRDYATAFFPAKMDRVELQRAQAQMQAPRFMFRLMVFKNWHDSFFAKR